MRVETGGQARQNFAMEVGEVTETIEVSAAAVTLQTENAITGSVVGSWSAATNSGIANGITSDGTNIYITDGSRSTGGRGVDVWAALGYMPEWRWMLDRSDCPWYPSMQLFRQPKCGDWNAVFEQMYDVLCKRTGATT